jgi:hypothetical protein
MCMLFNMQPGPPVGAPLSVRTPLEPIKERARTLEHKSGKAFGSFQPQALSSHKQNNTQVDVGFYAPAA